MKIEIDLAGFHRSNVAVYHRYGTSWGILHHDDGDEFVVRTKTHPEEICELIPTTKFKGEDIDFAEVKGGVLYIHLKKGRFVTAEDYGVSWTCDDGDYIGEPCVYDLEHDPCADNCIYCGQPFERK